MLQLLRSFAFNPYEDEEDQEDEEFDEDQVQEVLEQLQLVDLVGMLEESLSDTTVVDYEIVNYVLTRLPLLPDPAGDMKDRVLDVIIDNGELLYPLSEQIAKYVLSFEHLPKKEKKKIAKKLLKPLKSKNKPPDYYAMWMLHIFSVSKDWYQTNDIVHLYQQTSSVVVKRYAALAIAKGGTRAETLVLKDDLAAAPDLLRPSILEASKKLGKDERKHWKLANQINGITEKVI